ncbi:acyltransferase family protein [Humitalea sp. 24SJ18S-53]|uniref:acyltransferase family protein n=1 Tax=Humitalea sp. 24SJ18S-53 TaxID=3422307 RepID=UPI003D672DB2
MSTVEPIRALTGLRGLAAWWVVLYHFREAFPAGTPAVFQLLAGQGYLAVDLFFQLSGFVIALNYARSFKEWNLPNALAFLHRRLARIYPLHIFMLTLFILNPIAQRYFSSVGQVGDRYSLDYFILSLGLVQNWGFTDHLGWNIPAWSISTEWFAYLVFPPLVLLSLRAQRSAAAMALLAASLLAILAGFASFTGAGLGEAIPHFGLVRCLLQFQIGVCLYHLRAQAPADSPVNGNIAAGVAGLCFLAYATLPLPDYSVMPLGFFCLIYALADPQNILARGFRMPALEWIGEISYSTYLVHYFVKDWVKFLLVRPGIPELLPLPTYLAITAVLSVVLYKWIEVPGQRAMRGWLLRKQAG